MYNLSMNIVLLLLLVAMIGNLFLFFVFRKKQYYKQQLQQQQTQLLLAQEQLQWQLQQQQQYEDKCSQIEKLSLERLQQLHQSQQQQRLLEQELQHLEQKNSQQQQQDKLVFEQLAQQILQQKQEQLSISGQQQLEQVLAPFKLQLQNFQQRIEQVQHQSSQQQGQLSGELKHLLQVGMSMNSQAEQLSKALKGDNKIAGNWGEVLLDKTLQLSGLIKGQHYHTQAAYKNQQGQFFYPDVVVALPDAQHIVIDSKVSLKAYEQWINAEHEQQQEAKDHIRSVKQHIDALSKKDYSQLLQINSPSFVLMFMPVEPAYIEALRQDPQLFNYGFSKNIILVSHTTLMPIMRTIANLWTLQQGNEQANQISEQAGDLFNQVVLLATRFEKLGASMQAMSNHYNQCVTALAGQQGVVSKVSQFKNISTKANKSMPELTQVSTVLDTQKLQVT